MPNTQVHATVTSPNIWFMRGREVDISDCVDATGSMGNLTGRVLFILPRLRRPTLYPRVSRNSSGITLDSDSQTQELGVVMNPHQGAVTDGLYVTTSLCSRRILVLRPDPENEAERLSRNLGVMNSAMQQTRLSTFTAYWGIFYIHFTFPALRSDESAVLYTHTAQP